MSNIQSVTPVNSSGAGTTYAVGGKVFDTVIHRIEEKDFHILGDPYPYYAGFAENGELLFKINCLIPVVVEYAASNPLTNEQ